MAQVLVLERLKSRARLHGRSLQGELKAILEAAAQLLTEDRDLLAPDLLCAATAIHPAFRRAGFAASEPGTWAAGAASAVA
jgi:plasmid stability protein